MPEFRSSTDPISGPCGPMPLLQPFHFLLVVHLSCTSVVYQAPRKAQEYSLFDDQLQTIMLVVWLGHLGKRTLLIPGASTYARHHWDTITYDELSLTHLNEHSTFLCTLENAVSQFPRCRIYPSILDITLNLPTLVICRPAALSGCLGIGTLLSLREHHPAGGHHFAAGAASPLPKAKAGSSSSRDEMVCAATQLRRASRSE